MVTKGICLAKLSLCGYGIIMRRTYILFSFLLMACLLLGGCGLLFGDAAGELRDDGGTKMPAAQGERIPYKLSIEVDGERRATADEKRAAATDPDGESEGVSLGGSPEEGDEAGPAAPQADAPHREGTGAAPSAPKGNSGLSDKMRDLSQLEQLRSDPPDSLLALERRARGDVETAVKLLHSQGYYDGTATFQMDSTTKPVTVRLHLTPGPRYVLGRASVRYEPVPVVPAALKHGKRRAPYSGLGALWGDEAREATPPPRFPDTLRGVTPGEPVTADQMLEAVEKLPERLRRRGYPLAQVSSQRYFLDRAARTLNAEIVVDTGPPALLGEIVVEGNKDVSTTYIRERAPWKAGTEPWNESRVQDYVDELRGLGLFSMVRQRNIKDVPSPRKDGMVVLPVQLVVREGPPRSVSAAARYETDSGIGVEGEWEHRNFFGNGEKLVVSLPITPEKQGLKASFEKPAFLDRDQKLVGEASLLQEFTDAYDRRGLRVGAGIERRLSPYWWVGVGASSDSGTLTENDRTNEPYSFVGPHLRIVRDSRNNKINPKRGSVLEINSKPIFGYYDGFFTALGTEVEGMFYYAPFRKGPNKGVIDDKLVLAARVCGGSMAGAEMNNLPSTLRYYAGGAGSVRGYSYQAIGPRNDKGDPSGGRSYQIVNLEARYKITDEIGIVPFLDGGMVYEDALPQIFGDMRWGAGLGLRYYTPIGPVRLDVATPLNPVDGNPPLQLYISIGQSF